MASTAAFVDASDIFLSDLRPRTVGELVDQAFRLYRRNFTTFLVIAAIVYVPVEIIFQVGSQQILPRLGLSFGGLNLLSNDLQTILTYFGQGALVTAVLASDAGRPVAVSSAYRQMFGQFWPLVGLVIVQLAIVGLLVLPSLWCLGLPILYFQVRFQVAVPALMTEKLGPAKALSRSWQLVQDYWWRTFGLTLVLDILGLIVASLPATLFAALVASQFHPGVAAMIGIVGALTVLFTMVFIPIQWAAIAVYYLDQRVRKEDYDLETAIAARYAPVAPQLSGSPEATPPVNGMQYPELGLDQPSSPSSPVFDQPEEP